MSTKQRLALGPIILEAFLVVLGVVLAYSINEWREHRNRVQQADTALQSIVDELSSMQESLIESLEYHSQLSDTIVTFMRTTGRTNPDATPDMGVFYRGFVNASPVLNSAWETALSTGVVNDIPYEKVLLASRIYESMDQYEQQSKTVGQEIYHQLFVEGYPGMLRNYRNLAGIIRTFQYRECTLVHEITEGLPQLSDQAAPGVIPKTCQFILAR